MHPRANYVKRYPENPEVNNISHRHQRRSEPRPQLTYTEIWRSSVVWFSRYERTHRHVYRNISQPSRVVGEYGEVIATDRTYMWSI